MLSSFRVILSDMLVFTLFHSTSLYSLSSLSSSDSLILFILFIPLILLRITVTTQSHPLSFLSLSLILFHLIHHPGIPTTALREIVLLRQLEHPNVVKLENVVMDPARLYLVFELVDTGMCTVTVFTSILLFYFALSCCR